MNLAELKCRISNGRITIPEEILKTMELGEGEEICLIYLAEDSLKNEQREFLLTRPDGAGALKNHAADQGAKFQIPEELLEDAGIPSDADLEVVCMEGKIVILPSEPEEDMIPEELMEIFTELGISRDKVKVVLRTDEGED